MYWLHPETELRKAGARFEASSAFRDMFATHTVVDDERRFVTGQNQNSSHETAQAMLALLAARCSIMDMKSMGRRALSVALTIPAILFVVMGVRLPGSEDYELPRADIYHEMVAGNAGY